MPEIENTKKGFFRGTVLPVGLSFATAVASFLPSKASAENKGGQSYSGPYVVFDTKSNSIFVDRGAVLKEIQHNNAYVKGILSDRAVLHGVVLDMTPIEAESGNSALLMVYDASQKRHVRPEEKNMKFYISAYTNEANYSSVQKHYLAWEAYYLSGDLRQFPAWTSLCHVASQGRNSQQTYNKLLPLYVQFAMMADTRAAAGESGKPMTAKQFEKNFRIACQNTLDRTKYCCDFRRRLIDLGDEYYSPNGVNGATVGSFRAFAQMGHSLTKTLEHNGKNSREIAEIWKKDCAKRAASRSGSESKKPSDPNSEKGVLKKMYDRVMNWANDRKIVKPNGSDKRLIKPVSKHK